MGNDWVDPVISGRGNRMDPVGTSTRATQHNASLEVHVVMHPKNTGSLNLAHHMPLDGLDFLISLSSISSVGGSRAQTNYTMANNFPSPAACRLWRLRSLPQTQHHHACRRRSRARPHCTTPLRWLRWFDQSPKLTSCPYSAGLVTQKPSSPRTGHVITDGWTCSAIDSVS